MPVVGVEIAEGGLDRGMAEKVLENVQWDAGVSEPGRAGMVQAGAVRQADVFDDLVPVSSRPAPSRS